MESPTSAANSRWIEKHLLSAAGPRVVFIAALQRVCHLAVRRQGAVPAILAQK